MSDRAQLRELWTDHVVWTRLFLVSAIAGLPDLSFASDRLMENQFHLGAALGSMELAALLRDHIAGAVAVVDAAMANDANRLSIARARWYANADQIATMLAPKTCLSIESVRRMMRAHLDQTFDEASARIRGDWARDVQVFDAIVVHILRLADALADGPCRA